ncbi:MAG: CvpA family protein [Chloroflexi bacterium]|nr:CvpA family protein [Chloroflexota bacterium]MCI0820440.1 CvpA family protein [Chloroflexota bacterium]MCI0832308.1 CvpA family protein [Chloroflexota bacterium]MCI0884140.1 CvpA family protein [Chloroflexota bacterium]
MNWLDGLIIVVLIGFAVAAFRAGLIREIVTLTAVIAGIVIAGTLYENLASDVLVFIGDENAAEAVAFLVLFGAVYIFGQIAAYMLKTGASLLMLGVWDRLGGIGFGLIKGLLIVQVLLLVFAAYPSLGLEGAVEGSQLAPYFVDDFSILLSLLPQAFEDRIDTFLGATGN